MGAAENTASESRPLDGRHALVTGGSRGIGAACALALAKRGASVTLLGRTKETLEVRSKGLSEAWGVRASYVVGDVTDADNLAGAIAEARRGGGPIAILVNNAGGAKGAPFSRTTEAFWDETLALNLTSVFACTRAVLPDMLSGGSGRIVNVASTAGLKGYPYATAYSAAKHGVIGLTRALARELAKTGITVNAVCPGFTDTDMTQETLDQIVSVTGRDRSQALGELKSMNPQGRLIQPEEVGEAVAWLCLPSSRSVTGQSILVDGGETA